jgi:hypothetical protein
MYITTKYYAQVLLTSIVSKYPIQVLLTSITRKYIIIKYYSQSITKYHSQLLTILYILFQPSHLKEQPLITSQIKNLTRSKHIISKYHKVYHNQVLLISIIVKYQ